MARHGNNIQLEEKPNAETVKAINDALAKKGFKAKNVDELFKQLDNNLIQGEVGKDWWDQLPQEVRASIFEGIENIETGNIFTNAQVIQEAKQKYGFEDRANSE